MELHRRGGESFLIAVLEDMRVRVASLTRLPMTSTIVTGKDFMAEAIRL